MSSYPGFYPFSLRTFKKNQVRIRTILGSNHNMLWYQEAIRRYKRLCDGQKVSETSPHDEAAGLSKPHSIGVFTQHPPNMRYDCPLPGENVRTKREKTRHKPAKRCASRVLFLTSAGKPRPFPSSTTFCPSNTLSCCLTKHSVPCPCTARRRHFAQPLLQSCRFSLTESRHIWYYVCARSALLYRHFPPFLITGLLP